MFELVAEVRRLAATTVGSSTDAEAHLRRGPFWHDARPRIRGAVAMSVRDRRPRLASDVRYFSNRRADTKEA